MRTLALVSGPCMVLGYLLGSLPTRRADPWVVVVAAGKALVASTIAWHVVSHYSPGRGRAVISAGVAVVYNQALVGWQSAALWAGAAAVLGDLAPPTRRWGTGRGLLPALALLFAYAPNGLAVGGLAGLVAIALTRRLDLASVAGGAVLVVYEWLAWAFDWRAGWGVPHGPELTLWSCVLAGLVAFGAWRRAQ